MYLKSLKLVVGCVIEGFPSNFKINLQAIQYQLNRRRPGQSSITTPRQENDQVTCVSGLQNQITLGSPLCFLVPNQNIKKGDYTQLKNIPRPGHADITYLKKYGIKAESGGGRASARQTIGRVIAGALAKQFLNTKNITFAAYLPALMAHAMLSIPATKGFQFGSGFSGTQMVGSIHNDKFDKNLKLTTNNSGGTLGGISTGQTFYFNIAFKPVSSISFPQQTHTFKGQPIKLQTKGRHDPCVLPRAPSIVDSMAAMTVMDLWLAHNSQQNSKI